MTRLADLLSNGTFVDNTVHSARNGNFQVGWNDSSIKIYEGNKPRAAWPVLQYAAALDTTRGKVVLHGPEAEYEHNTEDAFITLAGSGPLNFTLRTGNLIGCVKIDGQTLRVSSRFGDEFLKYIIADADGFMELPEHGNATEGGYDWLLIYLWLIKLKRAFRLGLPKAYATRCEVLSQVRGRIDPVDYFLNRDQARYRCSYREHSFDNPATRLIARTLQHLDSHTFVRSSHTLNQVFQIATHGHRSSLQELLATTPVRNPYYADYNPVLTLSKQILRNQFSDFGGRSTASAFFFDVSMLFEYFVRKLLKRHGAILQAKNNRAWSIPTGLPSTRRNLIPDLVFERNGATFLFDVKYKAFDFHRGVSREDLFQLHTYLGQVSNRHPVAGCGFIYPIRESRWASRGLEANRGIFSETITQAGRSIPFHVCFVRVPEKGDLADTFHAKFRNSTREFVDTLFARLSISTTNGSPKEDQPTD